MLLQFREGLLQLLRAVYIESKSEGNTGKLHAFPLFGVLPEKNRLHH
ncbi:MAG: hypothetical protein K0R65_23 [Crocinitomicaceae bacterium]|jgi:hypothetical protein|nr:hypothetical protein [Crocinitomicaceae bacterium]